MKPFLCLAIISMTSSVGSTPSRQFRDILHVREDEFETKYSYFAESERLRMVQAAKEMFYFGYDNYMTHAFPLDELNPILCSGRGPDYENPSNININDVLGDYSLSLLESLGTLAIMGNSTEFRRAVGLVIQHVSFNKNNTVQVFEASIRVLGSLLSAHLLIEESGDAFGDLRPSYYDGELLELALDLGSRLLNAFDGTKTGLPYPRVNLWGGAPQNQRTDTCTAGAGSLLLEWGILSRLSGDPSYEFAARRSSRILFNLRAKSTGLLGNVVDVMSGQWISRMSGVGAGMDSYFEYLLKSYILFGEREDWLMFNASYTDLKRYLRRGRSHCNNGFGDHPIYVNVDMSNGLTSTPWIDSLQAAFPGIQVLAGDVEEAICAHALYYTIWKLYGALPERFNWQKIAPEVHFYPLRPELVESTYLLYQVTKNPFYLHVGKDILVSLNAHTKVKCGYATVHNVLDMTLEDRMESFFLSETCKYLYLLFDTDHYVNKNFRDFLFSTEGHIFRIRPEYRQLPWSDHWKSPDEESVSAQEKEMPINSTEHSTCNKISPERQYLPPLKSKYAAQLRVALGLDF
ncbi:unnamed protein product [Notodromas monacha]|uniref:alpha-1,2-Mannosidase n=1 Tax=Notodromas monacha TaxID=399045 RepID=A0A7R9BD22_9CRUS|nr:unnamed protein product [Notodromas monacha]CAG0912538.1 unnamed protein product [Notodromas monacha]